MKNSYALASIMLALLISGCTSYMAVGSFKDLDTAMYGKVNADLMSGGGTIAFTTVGDTHLKCVGDARVIKIPSQWSCKGQEGVANFKCSDGRTAAAKYVTETCTTGHGTGRDSRGNDFGFVFGMNAEEAKQELQGQLQRKGIANTPDLDRQLEDIASRLRNARDAEISEAIIQTLAIGVILYSGYQIAKHSSSGAYYPASIASPAPTKQSTEALNPLEECRSNLDCASNQFCLKPANKTVGSCAVSVDQYGNRTFSRPESDYGQPGVKRCSVDLDCGIGFMCSSELNACVKR